MRTPQKVAARTPADQRERSPNSRRHRGGLLLIEIQPTGSESSHFTTSGVY
jgi:hypothetical protein